MYWVTPRFAKFVVNYRVTLRFAKYWSIAKFVINQYWHARHIGENFSFCAFVALRPRPRATHRSIVHFSTRKLHETHISSSSYCSIRCVCMSTHAVQFIWSASLVPARCRHFSYTPYHHVGRYTKPLVWAKQRTWIKAQPFQFYHCPETNRMDRLYWKTVRFQTFLVWHALA